VKFVQIYINRYKKITEIRNCSGPPHNQIQLNELGLGGECMKLSYTF